MRRRDLIRTPATTLAAVFLAVGCRVVPVAGVLTEARSEAREGPLPRPGVVMRRPLNTPAPLEYAPRERARPVWDPRDGHVYVGDRFGTFHALDAEGRERWTWRALGPIEAGAVLDGDRLYVVTTGGEVVCLDRHTGRETWRYRTEAELTTTPTRAGDLLLVPSLSDTVTALDAATGTFRWFHRRPPPSAMTIRGAAGVTVVGEAVFTAFSDGTVVRLDLQTGEVVWERTFGAGGEFVDIDTTPVVVGDMLFVAGYDGTLRALDTATGTLRWQAETAPGTVHLLRAGDRLLALAPGEVVAHRIPLEGSVVWRVRLPRGVPSEGVLAAGRLVLATGAGPLYALSAETGRPLAAFQPGKGVSAPVAAAPGGARTSSPSCRTGAT